MNQYAYVDVLISNDSTISVKYNIPLSALCVQIYILFKANVHLVVIRFSSFLTLRLDVCEFSMLTVMCYEDERMIVFWTHITSCRA